MQRDLNLPQWVLELPIKDLDLSVRSYNALSKHISTVGELLKLTDSEMLDLSCFGSKSLVNVSEAIEKFLASHIAPCGEEESNAINGTPLESPVTPHLDPESLKWSENGWLLPEIIRGDLDASVEFLDLTTRPSNVLLRLEIRTVRQLLGQSVSSIANAENSGRKSVTEVRTKLLEYLSRLAAENVVGGVAGQRLAQSLGTKAFVNKFLAALSGRQQDVIGDRYGLWDGVTETLQDVGDKYGLTRERIRQIEAKSLRRLSAPVRRSMLRRFVHQKLLGTVLCDERTSGVLSKDEIVSALADDCALEEATLAITLMQDIDGLKVDFFTRFLVQVEEEVFCADQARAASYLEILSLIEGALKVRNRPVTELDLTQIAADEAQKASTEEARRLAHRVVTVSPSIAHLKNGTVILADWTSFRRRDVASLAESTLIVLGRPAHFREIAQKIESTYPELGTLDERRIHTKLISRRDKFVWVKAGTYGLKVWGLKQPPYLKDKLVDLLSDAQYPIPYWHLKQKALEVCNCKETSVRMTLDLNPKTFKKFADDQYGLRKHFG